MPDPNPNPNPNPNPDSGANPTWWSGIDFGEAKDTAGKALESFKTPSELVSALDWRKTISGGDEKAGKTFERFSSLADVGKAYREAQAKIRSGEMAKPLPKDASPEQVAEWRAANGVPEKPDGYFQNLPNGVVIGKDDQELFNSVAERLHAKNVSPEVMHDLVGWYYDLADKETAKVAEADKTQAREAVDALREEWGADYRANLSHVMTYLDGMGAELKEQFMDATLPDGRRVFNSPEVIKWLASQAREINPANVITGADGANQMQSIETEIAGIEKLMRTNRAEYNKDEKKQARLRTLYEAREKLKTRAA